jgi:hypothetical protein
MARTLARRLLLATASAPALLVAVALPANAGNAQFIKPATSASQSGTTVTVSFKEAGLASGSVETVSVSALTSTAYECVNGGGKNPSASNKRSFTTTVRKSGTFSADRNGNVVGSETLSPPSAASLGFSCPSGQQTTFVSVSYSNLTVKDTTSGAGTTFSGTFSYTNPAAPAVR